MPTQNGFFSAATRTTGQQTDPTGSTCAYDAAPGADAGSVGCTHARGGAPTLGGIPAARAARPAAARWSTRCVERHRCRWRSSTSRSRASSTRSSASGCSAATRPRLAAVHEPGRRRRRPHRHRAAARPADGGTPVLGTKNGDAAIVERYSEEGATLLKNDGHALPLTRVRPRRRHPRHRRERQPHGRRPDQRGLDRLHRPQRGQPAAAAEGVQRQARARSRSPRPTTRPATRSRPSRSRRVELEPSTGNLDRTGPARRRTTRSLDFTTAVAGSQLAPGSYTWSGYVYVPTTDTYTFAIQQSAAVAAAQRHVHASTAPPARWPTRPTSTAPRRPARPPTRATPSRC